MKKILCVLSVLVSGLFFVSAHVHAEGEDTPINVWRFNFRDVFDTYVHITIYTTDTLTEDDLEPLYYEIYNTVWRVHDVSTKYPNPYIHPLPGETRDERKDDVAVREARVSVREINDNPGVAHVVDSWLLEMIQLGIDVYNDPATNQRFNIAMGSLLEVWKDYTERCLEENICELPSAQTLAAADILNDPNLIVIDATASTVTIPEGMMLDLGGLAKGYGADRVGDILRDSPFVNSFLVDAGGSSIELHGNRPHVDDGLWRIGLTEPDAYGRILMPGGTTVGTSSGFKRFYRVPGDDTRYHHLIDPDTRFPAQHMQAVTVLAEDTRMVDLHKSIAFLMELDDSIAYINGLEGVEALWVDNDGTVHLSDGFSSVYTLEYYDEDSTSLWIYALGGLSALMILAVAGYYVASAFRHKNDEVDYAGTTSTSSPSDDT